MNTIGLIFCLIVADLIAPFSSEAISSREQIKRADITNVCPWISINAHSEVREGLNLVSYTVSISPPTGIQITNISGNLGIYNGTNLLARCNVAGGRTQTKNGFKQKNHTAFFQFSVASSCVSFSKFEIILFDPEGPGFSAYWFYLKDFE